MEGINIMNVFSFALIHLVLFIILTLNIWISHLYTGVSCNLFVLTW